MYAKENKYLTQLQLSKELGVHESTISNWEHGLREPDLEKLLFISKYFNIDIDYLLNNAVTVPEHYFIVNETFPRCLELLFKASKNLHIKEQEKLIKIIKRIIICKVWKGGQDEGYWFSKKNRRFR